MSEVLWEYVLAGLIVAAAVFEIWLELATAKRQEKVPQKTQNLTHELEIGLMAKPEEQEVPTS